MFLVVGLIAPKLLNNVDEAKQLITKDAVNSPSNQIIMLEAEDESLRSSITGTDLR